MTRRQFFVGMASTAMLLAASCNSRPADPGWVKYPGNPVLGGSLGTCFDVCLLEVGPSYWMWFSWRPRKSIALTRSLDGIHWSEPEIALGPDLDTGWESEVNRPVVGLHHGVYHMWYTGQTPASSAIGYAHSTDGVNWQRAQRNPVLSPGSDWEGVAVMAPHVMWEPDQNLFRMWYSGGEQYEPNAVGYATSTDGLNWNRRADNPVLRPDSGLVWEGARVTAAQVLKHGPYYYAFYIGFSDVSHAAIGLARSDDGITNWERHPDNPIISPGFSGWDSSACYKPFALFSRGRWMLWYNGRNDKVEQIGLATRDIEDLGF